MTARMTDEAFERLAGRIECYDLLTAEARRARAQESELTEAIRVGAARAAAEPGVAVALFQRLAAAAPKGDL